MKVRKREKRMKKRKEGRRRKEERSPHERNIINHHVQLLDLSVRHWKNWRLTSRPPEFQTNKIKRQINTINLEGVSRKRSTLLLGGSIEFITCPCEPGPWVRPPGHHFGSQITDRMVRAISIYWVGTLGQGLCRVPQMHFFFSSSENTHSVKDRSPVMLIGKLRQSWEKARCCPGLLETLFIYALSWSHAYQMTFSYTSLQISLFWGEVLLISLTMSNGLS